MKHLLVLVMLVAALVSMCDACGRQQQRRYRKTYTTQELKDQVTEALDDAYFSVKKFGRRLKQSDIGRFMRNLGNKAPTVYCPSVSDVTASKMYTSRIVRWSTPSVSDDWDDYTLRRISGKSSGSRFYEGTHTIRYKVTDGGGRTDTCSFSFYVRVIRCPGLSTPWHGSISCDGNRIYGRTCSFSCDYGYWLDGYSSSTCQRNGRNSRSVPRCKKKRCTGSKTMPAYSTGTYCTDGNYYGSTCSLSCDTRNGYTPRYRNYARCLGNTRWSYSQWKCDDTEKPKILNCPEGELKAPNNSYIWPVIRASDNSGKVTLTQKEGQAPGEDLIEGLQIIKYQAVDPSGNVAPLCVFSVTYEAPTCAAPVSGDGDYDPTFNCNSYKVGDACKVSCPVTPVVGAKFISCQKSSEIIPDSTWVGFEGPYPICYKKECPDLRAPGNGALVCDKFLGGEACQIHCNDNYDIPQSTNRLQSLTCLTNGGWTPTDTVLDCTEISFPEYYNLPSEVYYYGGDCSDAETNVNIRKNFLHNLNSFADSLCVTEECSIDNVDVTCGPISEADDDENFFYNDYYEYGYDTLLDFPGDDYPADEDTSSFPNLVELEPTIQSRKKRDVSGILPPENGNETTEPPTEPISEAPESSSVWTRNLTEYEILKESGDSEEGSRAVRTTKWNDLKNKNIPGVIAKDIAVDIMNRIQKSTNLTENDILEGSGGSGEGSGQVRRKKWKSNNTVKFDLIIKNISSVITKDIAVDILNKIHNSTMLTLNIRKPIVIRRGVTGELKFTCGPGNVLSASSDQHCVACPRGFYHDDTDDKCEACPRGTYSNTSGQTSCTQCDGHFSTPGNRSMSIEECEPMCPPGQFSHDGIVPCAPCPHGTFQSEYYGKLCTACPPDSTTTEMGSASSKQCIPFDVMVSGPERLNLGQVIPDWVEQVTLTYWIRTLPPEAGYANISFILSHPTRGHQMTFDLSRQTSVKMREDDIPVHTDVPQDLWTHMALVWRGYPRFLDIYRGGKRVIHYESPTPNLFLPQGTELAIDVQQHSSVMIREIYVIPHSNTSELISDMAGSCIPSTGGYKSLLTKTKSSDQSKSSIVIPSACSEINRCEPDPCPGHYCRSFKSHYECVCNGGFSGRDCDIPPDYCAVDNRCENDAECANAVGGVNCTCTDDYKGEYCETPIVHGNWSVWSSWSECSLTCGGGQMSRSRVCSNPPPEPELGKFCEGPSEEVNVCNPNKCPECKPSQLQLGQGISADCENVTQGGLNCSVACDAGLVFPEDEPEYVCQDEVWTPAERTLSCVEISVPNDVNFEYTIPYKTRVNTENGDTIRTKVNHCAANVTCVLNGTCSLNVTMETCTRETGGCPEFPEGYKASVAFNVPVIVSNISAATSERNLLVSYKTLNLAYSELEAMNEDCFVVLLKTGSLKPGTVGVGINLKCDQGYVPDMGYCSACAPGTKQVKGNCVQCDRGWYQDQSGQLTCVQCPAAYNTLYYGTEMRSQCLAPPPNSFMLVTDPVAGHMWSVNMSQFVLEPVQIPGNMTTSASAYDPVTKHIFFASRNKPAVHSVGPIRSETYVTLNWAASVDAISVDPVSRLLFYADKGNDVIGVVTMVKKYHKIILQSNTFMPRRIALDPSRGEIYWVDWGLTQKIERARYDGSNRQVLIQSTSIWPEGLALDLKDRRLYWSDGGQKTVEVMDTDGANRTTLVPPGASFPTSLTLFQDYIFYSAVTPNNSLYPSIVMRVNKDGSGLGETELPPFRYVSHIQSHQSSGSVSTTNGCSKNNGGCPFICFPQPDGSRLCACPEGYLIGDNLTDCLKGDTQKNWWDVWMKPKHRRRHRRRERRRL